MTPITRALVAWPRDDGVDAAPGEQRAHGRVAVAPIADESPRAHPPPAAPRAPHVPALEQRLDVARLVTLPARDDDCQRLAPALGAQVDLGPEAAAAAAERLVRLPADGARGALGGRGRFLLARWRHVRARWAAAWVD